MGIINWVQSRFNGRVEKRGLDRAAASSPRGDPLHEESGRVVPEEEEEHLAGEQRWPRQAGVLSIGTFGGGCGAEPPPAPEEAHDVPEFTIEEVKKLQDALVKILRRARSNKSSAGSAATADSMPLDRFLNCPSSLEVDRRARRKRRGGDVAGEKGDLSPDTKIILTKARDLLIDGKSRGGAGVRNKPFNFILKKMFLCNGGFAPTPSLKDPMESRMEKFLRTVLGKKINVRGSNAAVLAAARSRFLEDRVLTVKARGDHRRREEEEEEDSCRWEWDRTDSEFIVLEI